MYLFMRVVVNSRSHNHIIPTQNPTLKEIELVKANVSWRVNELGFIYIFPTIRIWTPHKMHFHDLCGFMGR